MVMSYIYINITAFKNCYKRRGIICNRGEMAAIYKLHFMFATYDVIEISFLQTSIDNYY